VVVSSKALLLVDKKAMKAKARVELGSVSMLSFSPFDDRMVVVHAKSQVRFFCSTAHSAELHIALPFAILLSRLCEFP